MIEERFTRRTFHLGPQNKPGDAEYLIEEARKEFWDVVDMDSSPRFPFIVILEKAVNGSRAVRHHPRSWKRRKTL